MKIRQLIAASLLTCSILSVSVSARDVDLKSMETAELLDLQSNIETELANRGEGGERIEVSNAVYTVGKDIAAGQYKIEAAVADSYLDVIVFKDAASHDNRGYTIEEGCLLNETLMGIKSITVKLNDNEILEIRSIDGKGFMSKAESSILLN